MLITALIDSASLYSQLKDVGSKVDYSALLYELGERGTVISPQVYVMAVGTNNATPFKTSLLMQGYAVTMQQVDRWRHGIFNLEIATHAGVMSSKVDEIYIGSSNMSMLSVLRDVIPIPIKIIGVGENYDINVLEYLETKV